MVVPCRFCTGEMEAVRKFSSELSLYVFDQFICYRLLRWASKVCNIRFTNLGYKNDNDLNIQELLRRYPGCEGERANVALYEKTLSLHPDYPLLHGLSILEVGCGQGGGLEWIKESRSDVNIIGMDKIPIDDRIIRGDAHNLPFETNSFDIILNVESSHLYGDTVMFFKECARVLKDGGHLCWADLRFDKEEKIVLQQTKATGLSLLEIEDITEYVVDGMGIVAKRYDCMIHEAPWYIKLFSSSLRKTYCAPGTETHMRYVTREKRYWTACWQKNPIH